MCPLITQIYRTFYLIVDAVIVNLLKQNYTEFDREKWFQVDFFPKILQKWLFLIQWPSNDANLKGFNKKNPICIDREIIEELDTIF